MVAQFRPFGAGHLAILGLVAAVSGGLIVLGRAWRGDGRAMVVSGLLFGLLLGAYVVDPFQHAAFGDPVLKKGLPLELCDAAGIVTLIALRTRHAFAFELALLWGLSGALQALLTPPLEEALGHPDSVRYFVLHGGIVASVLYLGPGLGMRTRAGTVLRVYACTAAYAAVVGLVDWAVGANYMFLCSKPPGSILEVFGPWPWYLAGGAAVGLALFWLIDLPYRLLR
jgi:hypothetical integral membrane protein (TIGR02206 family)